MRAVISFADTLFYQEKMKRLQASVEAQGIKFIGYTSCEQIGCRPHSEIPYQFKPYAMNKAMSEGVTSLLWLDSPIVAIKNIRPAFEHIEEHGYLFFENIGHPLGKWSHQRALDYFGMTREGAMNVPQIMACAIGLKVFNVQASDFFAEYRDLSTYLYPGSWDDSRHDQMVASFLIHKMGLNILKGHESFFMYTHFKDVFKIADSVCLESR